MKCVTEGCRADRVTVVDSRGYPRELLRCGPHELSAVRAEIERLTFYEAQLAAATPIQEVPGQESLL